MTAQRILVCWTATDADYIGSIGRRLVFGPIEGDMAMLPDPNKSIRRATMVARGLGTDIGKASAPMGDADIVRQALNTLRHYARGGFAVGGYDNGGFPTAPTPPVAPPVSLPAGGGATSDAP